MATFGWKRKVGERVSKATVQQFEQADDDNKVEKEGVDWLNVIKRRREVLLEDCSAKSKRLKDEGTLLAEQGRNWEALKRWDEALQLKPDDAELYDMKAQAVRSFQVALHLHPFERPLWEEDLDWALKLRQQKQVLSEREKQQEEARKLLVEAPELKSDYDFESDEVIDACTAMAEKQKKYEDLKKTAVIVETHGAVKEVVVEDDSKPASSSVSNLVKARAL
ncbi:tetratricopeptide repeat protein 33 isoform X2 [Triplophysa dalaica]|uniref:tetratricopeptide repeat protein 33 isoform X2 n=1 Tax=Triplophysa dalaica TaxID=1582913 RepID=UPI0024DF80BA|nr:tetratricopeptide repeat protein 33 isoform X2 [Triplophysa dalaica]